MKLKELFADPAKWTKGAFARNAKGSWVKVNSPEAVCWCLLGGVGKCYPDEANDLAAGNPPPDSPRGVAMQRLAEAVIKRTGAKPGLTIASLLLGFSDKKETTHEDVLAVCQEADV